MIFVYKNNIYIYIKYTLPNYYQIWKLLLKYIIVCIKVHYYMY